MKCAKAEFKHTRKSSFQRLVVDFQALREVCGSKTKLHRAARQLHQSFSLWQSVRGTKIESAASLRVEARQGLEQKKETENQIRDLMRSESDRKYSVTAPGTREHMLSGI